MMKNEINAGRPIVYSGSGHTWVIDGYKTDNTFHCNWGWNGTSNDWFYLNDLTPDTYNFNTNRRALTGIQPILDACSGLDGASIICPSNESYSVSIPSSASVVWSKSLNLDQVGGNTSPTYTVNAGSSAGSGYVTATIKNSQNQTFLTRTKDVWVGSPDSNDMELKLFNTDGSIAPYMCANTHYQILIYNHTPCSTTDYIWSIPSAWTKNYAYSNYISVYTNSTPGGMVEVYANTCCENNVKVKTEYFSSGYCGGYYSMSFTPNPTTAETTLTIESTLDEKTVDKTVEWELEVYSPTQALKEKKIKLKGKSTTIQTQSWKEGVYVVRVKYKDEILIGKLVVKK